MGNIVDPALVDKYALYQIARYCDELVDDGEGGLEPRFTCNLYLNTQVEAYKVLKDMATIFRGILYWMNGQVTAIQDSYKEPIYTFTSGNVIEGGFIYESTSTRLRYNQIRVTWNDPRQNYKQAVELIEDSDDIAKNNRFVPYDTIAFGCTSKGQARRWGAWHYITSRNEDELVKFSTAEAGRFIIPGDIINVQDQERYGVKYSGRVSSAADANTVTLDRAVTLNSNSTYELSIFFDTPGAYLAQDKAVIIISATTYTYFRGDHVPTAYVGGAAVAISTEARAVDALDAATGNRLMLTFSPHGHMETRTITGTGTSASVNVTSNFNAVPASDHIWVLKSDEASTSESGLTFKPEEYRVMSIEENDDGTHAIAAAKYYKDKYNLIDKGFQVSTIRDIPQPNPVREAEIPPPEEVTFEMVEMHWNDSTEDEFGYRVTSVATGNVFAMLDWSIPQQWTPDYNQGNFIATSRLNADLTQTAAEITLEGIVNSGTYPTVANNFSGSFVNTTTTDPNYNKSIHRLLRVGSGDKEEWIRFTGKVHGDNKLTGLIRGVNNTNPKMFLASNRPSVTEYNTVLTNYAYI